MVLPPESRASHDELFHAMMEFLRAGNKQLTDMERLGLCETLNPAKLSDAAAEQALRSDAVPIAYIAQIHMAQKVRPQTHSERFSNPKTLTFASR
jgi:hypothetical protein